MRRDFKIDIVIRVRHKAVMEYMRRYGKMNTSKTYLEIAREFAELLRARTRSIREIIVFGSVARDEATEKSDIDVALVVNEKDAATREIQLEAGEQIMNKYGALIGCVTYSMAEWEKARRFPFGSQVAEQGIKL